jgi:hypothetical protein
MTRQKSQGSTITKKVFIYIKDTFALDLAYAMLSRVTSRANLKIVGILTPNDFIPCNFENDEISLVTFEKTKIFIILCEYSPFSPISTLH